MDHLFNKALQLEKQGLYEQASLLYKDSANNHVDSWDSTAAFNPDFAQKYFSPVLSSYTRSIKLAKKANPFADVSFQTNAIKLIQSHIYIDPSIKITLKNILGE